MYMPLMHYSFSDQLHFSLLLASLSFALCFPQAFKSWNTSIRRWKGRERKCVMWWRWKRWWNGDRMDMDGCHGWQVPSTAPSHPYSVCFILFSKFHTSLSSHFPSSLSSSLFLPAWCCLSLLPLPPFIYRTCMVWSSAWIISSRLLIMNESGFCGSQWVGLSQRLIN